MGNRKCIWMLWDRWRGGRCRRRGWPRRRRCRERSCTKCQTTCHRTWNRITHFISKICNYIIIESHYKRFIIFTLLVILVMVSLSLLHSLENRISCRVEQLNYVCLHFAFIQCQMVPRNLTGLVDGVVEAVVQIVHLDWVGRGQVIEVGCCVY